MLIKILLRQPLHIIRSLSFISKIELSFIIITLYTYFTERIYYFIPEWQKDLSISVGQAAYLLTAIFITLLLSLSPIIIHQLIPKQKYLRIFYPLPINKKDYMSLIAYFYFKYQFILFLIFLPFFIAITIQTPGIGFYYLIFAIINVILIFLLYLGIYTKSKNRESIYRYGYLFTFLYGVLSLLNFFIYHAFIPFHLAVISLISAFVFFKYNSIKSINLEDIFPLKSTISNSKNKINFKTIPSFLPNPMQTIFNKELINFWRNPAYRRVKLFSLILYIIFLVLILIYSPGNIAQWAFFAALITIWLHYGNQFNDKYMTPDPDWYFHTLPLQYHHIWISKFIVEFIFVIILIVIQGLYFLLAGVPAGTQLSFNFLLLIFSIIALMIKLNFQILFYDSARYAGYAYHFSLIFITVMTINYRFVGPVISLFLLIFYFYKSYRFFKE